MIRDNSVIFKGGKNGLSILLSENTEYEHIKKVFSQKLANSKAYFSKANVAITFKGKELNDEQIIEMLEIINNETDLTVNFVADSNHTFYAKRQMETILQKVNVVSTTYLHMGSIRSGKSLESEDSIIIMGDINAGAEVRSHKHIFVFGTVRGMVHAGFSGDTGSIVCSSNLKATQIRIANLITYIPKEVIDNPKKMPTYAFIKDNQIFIDEIYKNE